MTSMMAQPLRRLRARAAGRSSGRPGRSSSRRSTSARSACVRWFVVLATVLPSPASSSATTSRCRRRCNFLTNYDATLYNIQIRAKRLHSRSREGAARDGDRLRAAALRRRARRHRRPDDAQAAQEPAHRLLRRRLRRASRCPASTRSRRLFETVPLLVALRALDLALGARSTAALRAPEPHARGDVTERLGRLGAAGRRAADRGRPRALRGRADRRGRPGRAPTATSTTR